MVLVVDLADLAQALGGALVVEVADQGVAGVGGHGDDAAGVQHLGGLPQQAHLGVVGVDVEVLGHASIVTLAAAFIRASGGAVTLESARPAGRSR